jgi:hypothetical protein
MPSDSELMAITGFCSTSLDGRLITNKEDTSEAANKASKPIR